MTLLALVLAAIVAIVWAFSPDRFKRIADVPLRWLWFAPVAFGLQWLVILRREDFHQFGLGLLALSQVFLLLFVWRNRHLTFVWIIGLGFLLNFLVMVANGGFMPIAPETLTTINPGSSVSDWELGTPVFHSKDIVLAKATTRLWFLSDILVVPPPFPLPTAFSIGDALIVIGFVLFFVQALGSKREAAQDSEGKRILNASTALEGR
ncbi:MAG: DUF5317 domain-containing protein [Anaerolineae bacterium]